MRRRLYGHTGRVDALVFSNDGRKLATGGQDSTILIWELAGPANGKQPELSAAKLDKLWQALAGDDAAIAFDALLSLAASPTSRFRFLPGG